MAKFRFVGWLWEWLIDLEDFKFEWDEGNVTKSHRKHGVTAAEAEEIFRRRRFIPLGEQYDPPAAEPRFGILGETSAGRMLFLAFALRGGTIRVISARPMSAQERKFYVSLREE